MTAVALPETARDDVEAFLKLWGTPTDADLRLWLTVLQPVGDGLAELLAVWLQNSEKKPHPHALLGFYAVRKSALPMREIVEPIMVECGVSLEDIQGDDKSAWVVKPRQRIMFELFKAGFSTPAIGRFLRRNHSTVAHGIKVWEAK